MRRLPRQLGYLGVGRGVGDVVSLFKEYKLTGANILHEPKNYLWAYEMKYKIPTGMF